jgi:hypothetical protein
VEDYLVTDNRAAVSAAIRERLIELRMRPYQLAELTALSSPAIRQILNRPEKHRPTRITLKLISEALGWPPKYLENVLNGRPLEEAAEQVTDAEARLSSLEARIGAQEQLLHKIIAAAGSAYR